MFEKIGTTAERVAIDVSRRSFFGCVGRWAAATALGTAGVLASAGTARAGTGRTCCQYIKGPNANQNCKTRICINSGQSCPGQHSLDCALYQAVQVSSCQTC